MASKKIRAAATPANEELSVDMSPMIDMVFLLLIFFIIASTVIVVKQDPNVEPPVAKSSKKAKDGEGRIVLNVRKDGSFWDEKGTTELEDGGLITEYIREKKDLEETKGKKPRVHLRGDKGVSFKYVRTVVRSASEAGIDDVIFSVFGFE